MTHLFTDSTNQKINYSFRIGGNVRYVVAITGASGIAYGVKILKELPGEKILVISEMAKKIIPKETELSVKEIEKMADAVFDDNDLFASISSGSYAFDAMIVAPGSSSSLAKIATGLADTLITRAAAVAIKESRKLILVTRETPKSAIMLENELKLARCGVIILDANPGFYSHPKTVDDIISFIAGRCLDQLRIDHSLYKKWE
jgi:4-hydroxy-3-polyprenylbenzoate decarboxylase